MNPENFSRAVVLMKERTYLSGVIDGLSKQLLGVESVIKDRTDFNLTLNSSVGSFHIPSEYFEFSQACFYQKFLSQTQILLISRLQVLDDEIQTL